MRKQSFRGTAINCVIFTSAVAGTYFAQAADRPITAVLVFLTGVIGIAFRSGLASGLIAAISASIIYNFFLSEPTYRFGLTSADEALPLVAFNVSAFVAAVLVGRLRDSARKAFDAQFETAFLLTVSDRLQSAFKVEEVEAAVSGVIPRQDVSSVEVYLARGNIYHRPSTGEVELDGLKPHLIEGQDKSEHTHKAVIVELIGAGGLLGFVKFCLTDDVQNRERLSKLQSIAAMLGLAVERCLLLEEIAEARALVRSEALKDALLSSVSHDLRTPVTVIQAAAGALSSDEVSLSDEERARLLTSILDQCARLDRYTAELLDVGQIQSGISQDSLEIVDIIEISQLAIKNTKAAHPCAEVERFFPNDPLYVRANAAMLEQAIYNILDNAQKFGGETGVVNVSFQSDDNRVRLAISDQGPGIYGDDKAQVFTRFSKGNDGKGGMGLGLFIAKGFVEAFSGSIDIESPAVDGRGTRVVVELPLFTTHAALIPA